MMRITPHVQWTTPAPLWQTYVSDAEPEPTSRFEQPTLLRFSSDDFMEELLELLGEDPGRLRKYEAKPEVWSGRLSPDSPLKFFQPAHQRYYLVATNLVCRTRGLPDRVLARTRGEQTFFVVRRLIPKEPTQEPLPPPSVSLEPYDEYAFVVGEESVAWQEIGPASSPANKALLEYEQQYPLFGLSYCINNQYRRRLLAGLVPVGKVETFLGAQQAKDGEETTPVDGSINATNDPRLAYLHKQVVVPWRSLINEDDNAGKRYSRETDLSQILIDEGFGDPPLSGGPGSSLEAPSGQQGQLERQKKMASWYILLDLADFLEHYQIKNTILQYLEGLTDSEYGDVAKLKEALETITIHRERLEGATLAFEAKVGSVLAYHPPDLPGSSVQTAYFFDLSDEQVKFNTNWPEQISLTDYKVLISEENGQEAPLVLRIAEALQDLEIPEGTPEMPLIAQQAALANQTDLGQDSWFIVRCVFDRPWCVGQARTVVSEATQAFQMASFFDPEAPSRPVRISLPLDTSPAGLRKFSKNAAFVLSDILACQLGQVQNITLADLVLSVLPWPFHKPLPDPEEGACGDLTQMDGMICSLSIPIVTVCALILLIIIVNVLDYFFRWIPFLITCFKLPGLKGKGKR